MDFIKKNKILLAALVATFLVAVVGVFLITSSTKKQVSEPIAEEVQAKSVSPEEIGLDLAPSADSKAIVMKITKLDGISSVEYEVSYDAEVTEEGETNNVPRGAVGSPIEIKDGDSQIKREITLGTCSANKCKYDKVTSAIKFVIKVTYANGDIGSVEKEISL